MSNIATVDADIIRTGTLAIGDAGGNIYVGSNSGVVYATNPTNFNNVALGVGAAAGISGVSNSVFIGSNAGYLLSNANDTTIIGTNDTVVGSRNVVIGSRDFVYGSNNLIIGSDLSTNESYKLNIANLIIGDIGNDVCGAALIFNSDVRINGIFTSELFDASGLSTTNIAVPGYIRNHPSFAVIMDISEGNFHFSGPGLSRVSDVSFYNGRIGAYAGIVGTGFDLSSGLTLTGNISNSGTHTASNFIGTASASNSIGGVTLNNNAISYSGSINGSTDNTSNRIGGVILNNTNVSNVGTVTATNAIVSGYLRNALGPTQFDISGGNISNSGTHTASNFIGTASASNSIGGITLNNSNMIVGGYLRNALSPTQFDISGGNISNSATHRASNFITPTASSNSIGGVTLNGNAISYSGNIVGSTDDTSNRIGGVLISNSGIYFSNNIVGSTDSISNRIGGITLNDGSITYYGRITALDAVTSNYIGGVTLSNFTVTANTFAAGRVSNGTITSNYIGGVTLSNTDISYNGRILGLSTSSNSIGGVTLYNTNISNAGTTTSSNFIGNASASNSIGGVILNNSNVQPGSGTAAAPSYAFSTDTAMGMYRVGTQALGFAVGGSNRMTICGDKVGIGTTTPGQTLTVAGDISCSTTMYFPAAVGKKLVLFPGNAGGTAGLEIQASEFRHSADVAGMAQTFGYYTGTTFTESMRVVSNKVGIGTTVPSTALTVVGDISATNLVYTGTIRNSVTNTSNVIGGVTLSNTNISNAGTTTSSNFIGTATASNSVGGVTFSNSRIGIGITSPIAPIDVFSGGIVSLRLGNPGGNTSTAMLTEGSSNAGLYMLKGANNNFCGFSFWTTLSGTTNERFRIDANTGNVGIGTVAPTQTLDVSGLINIQTPIGSIGGSNLITFSDICGNVGRKRLGFGIYNPPTGTNGGGDFVINTYDDGGSFLGAPLVLKRSNGNVGLGTQTPAYQLHLSTDSAGKPTSTTWTVSSDERVKQNIELADVSTCYSIVKNLKLKRFTWDASYMPDVPDRNSVGWIAQDVSFVFPNAVTRTSNEWFPDFHGLDVDQIYKTMYGALEKVIADKEVLETRVATLESQLSDLLTRFSNAGL